MSHPHPSSREIIATLRHQARQQGFADLRVARVNSHGAGEHLQAWLEAGYHGQMDYMARQLPLRLDPSLLLADTRSIIVASLPYPLDGEAQTRRLADPAAAVVSSYARGRDYHKVVRQRLRPLARWLEEHTGATTRICCDSAPVLEVAHAEAAGLGWTGRNTLLLTRQGSALFLGEILTNLTLAPEQEAPAPQHCGRCTACLSACPTGAFVRPGLLDARRCISYLTIEEPGDIPEELRPLMGNRIYGCDDCQTACPWNRFTPAVTLEDFQPRNDLDNASLAQLAGWSAAEFDQRLAGSPIRRIGIGRWRRNLAVALGNAGHHPGVADSLQRLAADADALVRRHARWALRQLEQRRQTGV